MRTLAQRLATLALIAAVPSIGLAQATKAVATPSKGKAEAPASFRTLTGTIGEVEAGHQRLTLVLPEAGPKGARAAQSWTLGLGKQTLLLRANKNGQYSTIDFNDLAKGETIQVVADLEADADKAHRAWWLISYPSGTTPPAR